AWELLREARETLDRMEQSTDASLDAIASAREELLIAQGSDWFWWYSADYSSVNRLEFDRLFRDHLTNAYRSLGLTPPVALGEPIIQNQQSEHRQSPLQEHPKGLL